ncbi:MAG: long-chain fatty acid--CoA ligase [Actinobacteria bacterium]|nr:long-chain fatty acid--CoA ligase [Actinomycetota bacterium]MBU1944292.1 long-chain fatty acid--CoA ligase [Actinomycetota bacterium]MBU2688277.1 long-chain fatty acid--CoA ligase [Actinomycetota bacterium]
MRDGTIGGMFFNRVEKYGDRVMMKHKGPGVWTDISWNEFGEKVRQLGLAMIVSGVQPGDRVAIFSPNCPEWQMADMAIQSIGAVNVPLYATITAKQAEYILEDSGSKMVFVGSEDHMNRVLEVRDNLPALEKIVTICETSSDHPAVMSFEELRMFGATGATDDEFGDRLEAVKPDDLCSIVYTSGTTGNPKGVMLTHRNFMSNVRAASSLVEVDDSDICLSFLPLSHVLERMSGYYTAVYNGVSIAHAQCIDTLAEDIAEIKPHWMVSVPRLYEKVYAGVQANVAAEPPVKQKIFNWAVGIGRQASQLKVDRRPFPLGLKIKYAIASKLVFSKISEKLGGRLRFFFSGGAPLAREIAEFFSALGVTILEGFGLTETSPVLTVNRPDAMRFGSVGTPLPGVQVRIAPDGEILARGPNIMRGYWNRPADSSEALADGWFHTGDIGHIDPEGFLFITDRKKDLIVTAGGKNVAPQNVENALKLDSYIEQAAVIGDRRRFISALIVPAFEVLEAWAGENGIDTADRAKLVADPRVVRFMQQRVDEAQADFDRHERVMRFVLLGEEMTEESGLLTPTLKVKRKEVASRFAEQIESMYAEEPEPALV